MPPCISENVTVYWVMLFKNSRKFKFITALIVLAVLIAALGMSCTSRDDINHQVNTIVKGYVFSIAGWEVKTLWNEAKSPDGITAVTAEDIATVEQYFELTAQLNALKAKRNANQAVNGSGGLSPQDAENEAALQAQRDALKGRVEAVIERQIRDTLKENGIYNPFFGKGSFPPVDFTISTPPNLLIISPREKIERTRDIMLLPDLTDEEIESLERQTSALGISTIIEPLGGLGATFPTFVQNDAGLQFTINCAVEEWLHQYLAFQPIGFNYVLHLLGIVKNYDIVTINETVAGIASDEIGALIYEKYYGAAATGTQTGTAVKPVFDFNAAMREIRINADNLLANGQVAQAEQYMEEQRQFLATKGYYIRKLNQAYFAFYGSYADDPTSVDPIGTKLRELRGHVSSVTDFLNTISGITSTQELDDMLSSNQ